MGDHLRIRRHLRETPFVIPLTPFRHPPCPSSCSEFNHPDRNSVEDPRPANSGPSSTGPSWIVCRRAISTATSGVDFRDVDFPHFHHRLESASGFLAAGGHGLCQSARSDLPGQAPAVLAPATGALLAAVIDNRVPITV